MLWDTTLARSDERTANRSAAKSCTKSSPARDLSPLISRTLIGFTRRWMRPERLRPKFTTINYDTAAIEWKQKPTSSAMRRCTGGTEVRPRYGRGQGPARGERRSSAPASKSATPTSPPSRPHTRDLRGKAEPAPLPPRRDRDPRRPPRRARRSAGIRRTGRDGQGSRRRHRSRRALFRLSRRAGKG